jgi:hypothetical protein
MKSSLDFLLCLQACIKAANYTFIVCGERNLDHDLSYWGNIRIAPKDYQEQPLEADIGRQESVLEYVDIVGAGRLHGEKVSMSGGGGVWW